MAEKLCNLIKNGGGDDVGLTFPDYSQATSIIEQGAVNFTPTQDGYMFILTSTTGLTVATITEDDVTIGNVCNSILLPVRKGHTYKSNVSVRQARFAPLVQ